MKTYTSKPRRIEAEQLTSELASQIVAGKASLPGVAYTEGAGFTLHSPGRSPERIRIGDYIVRDESGDARCVEAKTFEAEWSEQPARAEVSRAQPFGDEADTLKDASEPTKLTLRVPRKGKP